MVDLANPISKRVKSIGPAVLVTAAFIGPGTVTTAAIAGASYGYTLLWALVFSMVAAIILQEMSARLGVVARLGLGDAIHHSFRSGAWRIVSVLLVISAIFIGNTAYEAGNITGAVIGLQKVLCSSCTSEANSLITPWVVLVGVIAFALLYTGNYKLIQKSLIFLVAIMSIVFVTTAIMVMSDPALVLRGLLIPTVPQGSTLTVIALVGTTVVPYNLFLHASAARENWKSADSLGEARFDTVISIMIGVGISMAIVITAAASLCNTGKSEILISDLSAQLTPLLGNWAEPFLGLGFIAAGITSAITAPLAAAYATAGILGWPFDMRYSYFRFIWIFILVSGVILASLDINPLKLILFAQITNGLLLPIVSTYLLVIMNNKQLLGNNVNGVIANIAGGIIVAITVGLGMKSILSVLGVF